MHLWFGHGLSRSQVNARMMAFVFQGGVKIQTSSDGFVSKLVLARNFKENNLKIYNTLLLQLKNDMMKPVF